MLGRAHSLGEGSGGLAGPLLERAIEGANVGIIELFRDLVHRPATFQHGLGFLEPNLMQQGPEARLFFTQPPPERCDADPQAGGNAVLIDMAIFDQFTCPRDDRSAVTAPFQGLDMPDPAGEASIGGQADLVRRLAGETDRPDLVLPHSLCADLFRRAEALMGRLYGLVALYEINQRNRLIARPIGFAFEFGDLGAGLIVQNGGRKPATGTRIVDNIPAIWTRRQRIKVQNTARQFLQTLSGIVGICRLIDADRDDFEDLIAACGLERRQRGHFALAWAAPGGPEIDQNSLALKVL